MRTDISSAPYRRLSESIARARPQSLRRVLYQSFRDARSSNLLEYVFQRRAKGEVFIPYVNIRNVWGTRRMMCPVYSLDGRFFHPTLQGPDNIEFYFVLKKGKK